MRRERNRVKVVNELEKQEVVVNKLSPTIELLSV